MVAQAHCGDLAAEQLAGGGVGELQLGPAQDAADLLEVGEGAVGLGDGGLQLVVCAGEEHDGDGLGAGGDARRGRRRRRARRAAWRSAASRSAGWMFMPAAVTMTSPLRPRKRSSPDVVLVGEVAGGEPLALRAGAWRRSCQVALASMSPRTRISPSSVIRTSRPGSGFADGAVADVEGMVEGDERGGLGHAVALDQGEAEAVPEGFELGGQRGSAGDDGPELPAQRAVYAAEAPPAFPDGGELAERFEFGGERWGSG